MEFQVNRLIRSNVKISEIEDGFEATVRGHILVFKKLAERQYEVFEGKEQCAYFISLGRCLTVLNPSGVGIMTVNEAALETMKDKECCSLVADMLVRRNEK